MAHSETVDLVEEKAALMRRDVIEMGYAAGGRGAHFGPAMSSIEIVAGLFFGIMNHDPGNPTMADRDRFVQSKGHACLALYSALGEAGYITEAQMATFKGDGSFLAGHPTRNPQYGIEVSSGTLGNGFAIACGMAKAAKIKGEDHKVFCLVGDGECNEGVIWEAAMNAVKYQLDNLIAIIDRNFVQLAGTTADIMDVDIEALWRAAGWDVVVVEDGNDAARLLEAMEEMRESRNGKPHMIIANTTKGKGISFMEGSLDWHARPMNEEQYARAIADLENAKTT
jgi:transketolase